MGQAISGLSFTVPVTIKFGQPTEDTPKRKQQRRHKKAKKTAVVDDVYDEFVAESAGSDVPSDTPDDKSDGLSGSCPELEAPQEMPQDAVLPSPVGSATSSSESSGESSTDSSDDSSEEPAQAIPKYHDNPFEMQKAVAISLVDTNDHTALREANMVVTNGELDEDDALQAALAASSLEMPQVINRAFDCSAGVSSTTTTTTLPMPRTAPSVFARLSRYDSSSSSTD